MNKKILAAAVAGALAVPGLALAQSSVTISGFIKADVVDVNNHGGTATVPASGRTGPHERLVFEDGGPSRIRFTMREDLGGGLYGLGQIELRHTITGNGLIGGTGLGSTSGNQWVGLESTTMGTLRLGSIDTHYIISQDRGGLYGPIDSALTLIGYMAGAAGGGNLGNLITLSGTAGAGGAASAVQRKPGDPLAVAGNTIGVAATASNTNDTQTGVPGSGTRTRAMIRWDSPNWNGFTLGVGYGFQGSGQATATSMIQSNNGGATTNGVGVGTPYAGTTRAGRNIWFSPSFTAGNWGVTWSHMDDKTDFGGTAAAVAYDKVGDRFSAFYTFSGTGFTVGFDADKSKAKVAITGTQVSERTVWQIPVRWESGPHYVTAGYSRAGDDKIIGSGTGAKEWAVTYAYLFSKRTSVGVGYSVLKNDQFAAYGLGNEIQAGNCGAGGGNNCGNGYNAGNSGAYVGETARVIGVSVRHLF